MFLLLQNVLPKEEGKFRVKFEDLDYLYKYSEVRSEKNYSLLFNLSPEQKGIINKCTSNSKALSEYGEIIQGLTPYDKYRGQSPEIIKGRAYHSDTKINETYGMYLQGKDLTRYCTTWSGEWLSYGDWLAAPRESRFFEGTRLLFREIPGKGKTIQANMVKEVFYYGHSISPFKPNTSLKISEIHTILGIANSILISFFGRAVLPNMAKDVFPKINPKDIQSIPIRLPKNDTISHLVMRILAAKQTDPTANTSVLEGEIDVLVYRLYGLTFEEVKVVDAAFSLSEEEYNAITHE
jgi:hypothetical protein